MSRAIKKKVWTTALLCIALSGAASASDAEPRNSGIYRELKLFAEVLSYVEKLYVEPVEDTALITGAIQGMVRTLDPHSVLLLPEDLEMLEEDTMGEFGGVGLEVGIKDNLITVIAPIEDTPASRAGILPGDQLTAIDGHDTADMSLDETILRMRGKTGTSVSATFIRMGEKKPFTVNLVREVIEVKSAEADMILPGFAWIRVRMFQDGTTAEVKDIVRRFEEKSGRLKGILLDLRRNPGGILDEAVLLSDLFVSGGLIVSTRGRNDETLDVYKAHRLGTIRDIPTVVLIDEASASAAEIVAGALQDRGRAMVVGNRSFGKGSVQSIIALQGGYGLKLTVARYFTPSGRSIQADGIHPDIVVKSRTPPPEDAEAETFPSESDLEGSLAAVGPKDDGDDIPNIEDYQLRVAAQLLTGLARRKAAAP